MELEGERIREENSLNGTAPKALKGKIAAL